MRFAAIILLILFFASQAILFPASADVESPVSIPFGGPIIKKSFKLCLIKVSYFPFVVPNPAAPWFWYYEVEEPDPPFINKLYYVPIYGKTYKLYRPERFAEVVGEYTPGASEAFRQTCTFNKRSLPFAFGNIEKWGTSCKPGEIPEPVRDKKCLKVLGR